MDPARIPTRLIAYDSQMSSWYCVVEADVVMRWIQSCICEFDYMILIIVMETPQLPQLPCFSKYA